MTDGPRAGGRAGAQEAFGGVLSGRVAAKSADERQADQGGGAVDSVLVGWGASTPARKPRADQSGDAIDSVLTALADPTRRLLLDLLAARGEVTATTLAGCLPVSRQAVVKHLAVLNAAGLVAGFRVGRELRYVVRPAALGVTARWMAALAADWERRLDAIKIFAEAAATPRPGTR